MSETVIKVENISKRYQLDHQNAQFYTSFREVITSRVKSVFRPSSRPVSRSVEEFWALQDLSCEIGKGDRVGIIGRNGAGKSTLLKILSRIVTPTSGRITIEGRVASLLEVGTGFHPELSGRENIFLNGAVLGMTMSEIKRKFDEIVAFSEVEQFLDTPVKRYSSGMYVRLAFAVAAHLEPEILIVDEVLAVGDADFQKKCLGKMKDVSGEGRTVLFVSHNMEAVQKLCNKGMLLQKGRLLEMDHIDSVVVKYLETYASNVSQYEITPPDNAADLPGYAYRLQVENKDGRPVSEIPLGEPWQVRIFIRMNRDTPNFITGMGFCTIFDLPVCTSWAPEATYKKGEYEVVFRNDAMIFAEGQYKLIVGLSVDQRTFQYVENAGFVTISEVTAIASDTSIINTKSGLLINQLTPTVTRTADRSHS